MDVDRLLLDSKMKKSLILTKYIGNSHEISNFLKYRMP